MQQWRHRIKASVKNDQLWPIFTGTLHSRQRPYTTCRAAQKSANHFSHNTYSLIRISHIICYNDNIQKKLILREPISLSQTPVGTCPMVWSSALYASNFCCSNWANSTFLSNSLQTKTETLSSQAEHFNDEFRQQYTELQSYVSKVDYRLAEIPTQNNHKSTVNCEVFMFHAVEWKSREMLLSLADMKQSITIYN